MHDLRCVAIKNLVPHSTCVPSQLTANCEHTDKNFIVESKLFLWLGCHGRAAPPLLQGSGTFSLRAMCSWHRSLCATDCEP